MNTSKILLLAMVPPLLTVPQAALAWGQTGHAAIANVAELNLRPAVWNEIKGLLGTVRKGIIATMNVAPAESQATFQAQLQGLNKAIAAVNTINDTQSGYRDDDLSDIIDEL